MSAILGDAASSLVLESALGEAAGLVALEGREALSEPFRFALKLTVRDGADPHTLLGAGLGVTLVGDDAAEGQRQLHGIATAIERGPDGVVVELRPWLSLLELRHDRRIFQEKTPAEIVEAVAEAAGYTDLEVRLQGSQSPLAYRVQAGESDFAFVARLLAEHGIAYFFTHSADAHTLVLVDDRSGFDAMENVSSLTVDPAGRRLPLGNLRLSAWDRASRVVTDRVTLGDFAFETPSTQLRSTMGDGQLASYGFPGGFTDTSDGDAMAKSRLEALGAGADARAGRSPCRQLGAGRTVSVEGSADAALDGEVVVTAVEHAAGRNAYEARFEALPVDVPFRPPLPPRAPAPSLETARVVGPDGEELFTDEHGRIKVRFAWDRSDGEDESASCWLRVAQAWAGSDYGTFFLPRIGQEVLIAFLDGDPDRPLVVGTVYNGDNRSPFQQPNQATRSGLRSRSTPGGDGANELSFEDKAGEEEVYLKAQKDWRIEIGNDVTQTITQNRTTTVEEGDETLTVAKGGRSVSVKGAETHETSDAYSHDVKGAYSLDVEGDVTIKTQGSLTLEAVGGITLKTSGGDITIDSSMGLTGKAGLGLALSGGTTMEVKGSATGTVDGGGILTVKGGLVQIN